MAGTSPRRSSRARTTQSRSHHSSATSSSSGRPERNTRAATNTVSPRKTTPTNSSSADDQVNESAPADDVPGSRRRTRAQDEASRGRDTTPVDKAVNNDQDGGEDQEDDEAVRCICGFDEYPGPIPQDQDLRIDHTGDDRSGPVSDATDDLAGFYVQCDVCKVWQHGACVGIMTEESSPDEYFCEQCRKDLHKFYKSSNGQRYSRYLPLSGPAPDSRTTSRSGSSTKEGTGSPTRKESRSVRQTTINQATKRRSTMNSRDAAYEEEQFRRAIEASKVETIPETSESTTRRAKRGRSDSEERSEIKRQKTGSRSATPDEVKPSTSRDGPEDLSNSRTSKKGRGAGTRNGRESKEEFERTEREERERIRIEAANKRKGRAERRRGEDDDPPEEMHPPPRTVLDRHTTSDKSGHSSRIDANGNFDLPLSQAVPDTPPTSSGFQATSKSKRSHQKKGKGRNQYTRDRDETSPARSGSKDGTDNSNGGSWKAGDSSKLVPRQKGGFNSKVSLYDMKRRATAMFDFIARAQIELGDAQTSQTKGADGDDEDYTSSTPPIVVSGSGSASEQQKPKAPSESELNDGHGKVNMSTTQVDVPRDFKQLSCVEMMDHIVRDLVHWQKEFAV